jgi:hypothetical protein
MDTKQQAAEMFERWMECRSILEQKTNELQKEMDAFVAGDSAMPSELLDEILELQKECVDLFSDVVKASSV